MRKLVSGFAASLDGYILGPEGDIDWILMNEEVNFAEEMKKYDAFFYGRKTYQEVVRKSNLLVPGTKNYVFSTTLNEVHQDFILIKGNVQQVVQDLKSEGGKNIALFGGAKLLASLLQMNLVDKISVSIIPVLLGSGKPMVDVLNRHYFLELKNTKVYSNGTVQITYAVKY